MVALTEQAWQAFHTPLHHFIRRRVADEAAAEDLLQEVFLKIHRERQRFFQCLIEGLDSKDPHMQVNKFDLC